MVHNNMECIVELSWRMIRGIPVGMHRLIWLAKAKLEDEGI